MGEIVPLVLVVKYVRRVFNPRPDEPMMIVGGTVYQVTDDLFFTPFLRCRFLCKFSVRNFLKERWNDLRKIPDSFSCTNYFIHIMIIQKYKKSEFFIYQA